jgi:hypothetical protein
MRLTLSALASTTVLVAAVLWPCRPGSYDPLALPLSMMARIVSWSLLIFVPIGLVWWCRDTFVRRAAGARLLGSQLEEYRRERGEFPESLLSVTTDYRPRSVGVPRFWYERAGDAYNLVFEQPPAALDMREFVVYNPGRSCRALLARQRSPALPGPTARSPTRIPIVSRRARASGLASVPL